MTTISDEVDQPIAVTKDVEQIDALNTRAWSLRATDTPQALALGEQARRAAKELDYSKGLAQSLYILGHCNYRIANYELGRHQSSEALALFESLDDQAGCGDALNTIGNIHSALGDHHSALGFYLRSLAIRQAIGNQQAEAASLNNIGNVYYHLTDYANALDAHFESLRIKQSIGDNLGVANSLNNIGNVHKETGDYRRAVQQYGESLAIFQRIGDRYGEAGALGNIGEIYVKLGNPQSALAYHSKSLEIEQATGNRYGEAESFLQLGELYLKYPDLPALPDMAGAGTDVALSYLQRALTLAQELAATDLIYKIQLDLSQLYQERGDFARALEHYQAFYAAEKQIFNDDLIEKTKKLQIIHQVESSRREADLQRAEAEVFRLKNIELAMALAEADRLRQIAEEASRLKSEMLSIAAHDLRNPLTSIIGYADIALTQLNVIALVGEFLERIRRNSRQMLTIVTNLLQSSALESGKVSLSTMPVDLVPVAHLVVDSNQQQAQAKSQTLHFSADRECVVNADQARIWEVFDNLIGNAIKYSPYEKNIWVSITRQAAMVRFAVRDEGPGLTQDDQPKLFRRFERLSAQATAGESSSGLGLSIVKRLVELHGGKVWGESDGPGTGSTFIVELPAAT